MADELFPYLTDAGSVTGEIIARTVPGQVYFGGTGPIGATCGGCESWRGNCLRFARQMPSASTIQVSPDALACKYLASTPDGKAIRAFALAEDNPHYRAEIESGRFVAALEAMAARSYKAGVIYADPAWPYTTYSARGKQRSPERHYMVQSIDDICALGPKIKAIAADDCALALWVVSPILFETQRVIEAWGFTYKSVLFVWSKVTAEGKPATGLGFYTRHGAEFVLLATRGRPKRVAKNVPQLLFQRRGAHSVKPIEIHHRLERLFGDVPRLELFSREAKLGWMHVGTDEVPA